MIDHLEFKSYKIRFLDEQPLAIDVVKALGYVNPISTISELKPRLHQRVKKMWIHGGELIDTIVLEDEGIYQLIRESHSPIADELQEWIFEEVFPFLHSR